jgi:chaperonin GroEL
MPITMKTGKEARAEILSGVKQLNDAVSATLGPAGRWILFRHGPMIVLTKDGVTVAGEINLPGTYESMGADRMKGAARQAVNEAGDGTTTAILLGHAIYEAGCKAIDADAEPVKLTRGIQRACKAIVGEYDPKKKKFSGGILQTLSIPCTPELAFQAARISANGDEAIAKVVSDVVLKVGVDGDVSFNRSFSQSHEMEFQEGLGFNSGWAHPVFINEPQRNQAVLKNALVLVLNRHLNTADEVMNLMRKAATYAAKHDSGDNEPFSVLIIADEFTPEALRQLVLHRQPAMLNAQGKNIGGDGLNVVAVRAPLYKDDRRDLLDDICLLTKATRIENPQGKAYESLSYSVFGVAEQVTATQSRTTITAGPADDEYRRTVIDPCLERLKAIAEDTSLRPDQVSNLKGRIAALTGGVAVIKIGGTSDNEIEKLKFQVEDALHATRAAVSEGVVPGGGSALLFARGLAVDPEDLDGPDDEQQGYNLLVTLLSRPLQQIASNAGYDGLEVSGHVVAYDGAKSHASFKGGFDASTGTHVPDMFAAGIVDPLRVVRASLNAAASEACLLLLTEVVLGQIPEEAPKQITGQIPGRR